MYFPWQRKGCSMCLKWVESNQCSEMQQQKSKMRESGDKSDWAAVWDEEYLPVIISVLANLMGQLEVIADDSQKKWKASRSKELSFSDCWWPHGDTSWFLADFFLVVTSKQDDWQTDLKERRRLIGTSRSLHAPKIMCPKERKRILKSVASDHVVSLN